MSGHSRWQLRTDALLPATDGLIQYTRGYLLALEDVLKDANDSLCMDELITRVHQTQQQAEQTLSVLMEQIDK